MAIDMKGESFGKAAQVADGFWIVATRHQPGGSMRFPAINNRCLVFRLLDNGAPVLLAINGVDPDVIPEVKRIEAESGLKLRYILSPGGGHHLLMAPWVDAFPEAKVLVGPERVPRTANGKKLMAMPRVSTMDPDDPLPQFKGQLEFVLFRGLYGMHDHPSPREGGSDSVFAMMRTMFRMLFQMTDPIDELWTFHVGTGTLIGGENLGWMYPAAEHAKLGMMKGMVKPDQVYVFKDARKVADAAMVERCWRKVLAWPATTVMTYHDPPGHAYHGDGRAALERAVKDAGQPGA
jgi:hypothetical protein